MKPDQDAALLGEILTSIIQAQGRGGLTWAATKLDISPSNLLKRLKSPAGAFDGPTLRAALLILGCKAEKRADKPKRTKAVGRFVIGFHETEEGMATTWKLK